MILDDSSSCLRVSAFPLSQLLARAAGNLYMCMGGVWGGHQHPPTPIAGRAAIATTSDVAPWQAGGCDGQCPTSRRLSPPLSDGVSNVEHQRTDCIAFQVMFRR